MSGRPVSRRGKELDAADLERIAAHLAALWVAHETLRDSLSGRVKVEWLDPLLDMAPKRRAHGGPSLAFAESLRNALDKEWRWIHGPDASGPFFGVGWQALVDAARER